MWKFSKFATEKLVVAVIGLSALTIVNFEGPRITYLDALSAHVQPGRPIVRPAKTTDQIERSLSSAEIHTYEISISAGHFFHATLEQFGTSIGATIHTPNGTRLYEFNCRQRGPTPISLIADDSGIYQLTLRSDEERTVGHYVLKFETNRLEKGGDQSLVAGERAFAEADNLRAHWKAESNWKAIEKYHDALIRWREADQHYEAANTLLNIGDAFYSLSEPPKALNYYTEALSISKRMNDHRGEGEALNRIGYANLILGETTKALRYFAQARTLSRRSSNLSGEAQALNNAGEAYYAFGKFKKSLAYYHEALSIWLKLGDRRGQALADLNCGYTYSDLGEFQKAGDAYMRALLLWRATKNRWGEAHTLTALGHLRSKLGEKQQALQFYDQARQLFEPMGERVGEAFVLNGMGYVYDELGNYDYALRAYVQALRLFQDTKYREGEAGSLWKIGRIYYSLGDYNAALAHYHDSLSVLQMLRDQRMMPYPLRDIGRVYEALKDTKKALEYYEKARLLLDRRKDERGEAYALSDIAQLHDSLGAKQKALRYYAEALLLNRIAGDRFGESSTLYGIARAQRDLGRLTEARSQIEMALGISESLRSNVASQELRTSYFASAHQNYELLIDVLMRLHQQDTVGRFDESAFNVSERARARSLLETLKESQANLRHGFDPALLERERLLQQAINVKAEQQARLFAARKKDEAEAIGKEIDRLTSECDQVRSQIKSQSPRYAALTQPQPLSLKDIQQQILDDNSVLLEYMLGDERSYLWAVTRTEFTSYELPGRAEIEAKANKFYQLLKANQPIPGETFEEHQRRVVEANAQLAGASESLSKLVISPVINNLGTKRLIIVPDGALQYIPFQALTVLSSQARTDGTSNEQVPLLVDHEIVYEPSASALALVLTDSAQRKPAPNSIAVFANPVFEADDPRVKTSGDVAAQAPDSSKADVKEAFRSVGIDEERIPALPASREEAESIIAVAPWGTGLKAMGFEASRETVMKPELAQYRIVHFATHGFVDYQRPELSGLVLSLVDQHGEPQDGFLRLHDIYNLKLSANLVVLSACNTGLGKEIKGEGLIGLTRGFMYAGATAVAASLWKVDDEATAELMKGFYEGMFRKGLTPAAALRESQLAMWRQKRWHAPYYWAAFTIQGQYDQREAMTSTRTPELGWSALISGLASAVLIAAFHVMRRRRSRIL